MGDSHSHLAARCDASSSTFPTGPWRQRVVQSLAPAPPAAHAADDAVNGSPRWPSLPGTWRASTQRLRHQHLDGRHDRHRLDLRRRCASDQRRSSVQRRRRVASRARYRRRRLDLLHVGHHRGIDHRRRRAIGCDCAIDRVRLPAASCTPPMCPGTTDPSPARLVRGQFSSPPDTTPIALSSGAAVVGECRRHDEGIRGSGCCGGCSRRHCRAVPRCLGRNTHLESGLPSLGSGSRTPHRQP